MSTQAIPQRLYLMQVARVPPPQLPIVCYLVQTSDNRNILIDTGLPSNATPPPGLQQPMFGKSVVEQLAQIGVKPQDVDTLICTHFDQDHTGYHEMFPNAQYIVQRHHYDIALTHPRFRGSRPHWDQPRERFRFVDGDIDLLPGLRLIETSGHVPGHQSVLVTLPTFGAVLLAIDAVAGQNAFTMERKAEPMDDNEQELLASTRKLLDIVEREQVVLTVHGHDPAQWAMLKTLPDCYE
jgi:N-acyl homoserine lactone hydrolase